MKFESHWYRSSYSWLTFILLPLSWLFYLIVVLRFLLFRCKIKKTVNFPLPVIVVGNLTVGGTGKTPFVIWLAHVLKQKGYRPGIVSRGVGGKQQREPRWVMEDSDPVMVGDEAVLLKRCTQCPLVVGIDRVAAVNELLQKKQCDCVISDDGLQHYHLGRDVEIIIVDAARQFGNRCLLPAGPLREPMNRLKRADFVVINGDSMQLEGRQFVSVCDPGVTMPLESFKNSQVHAIAAIGNPERFFAQLRQYQIQVIPHYFPDHYLFQGKDIHFTDDLPVIMTEKDAVKCKEIADERHWFLPVEAKIDAALGKKIINQILERCGNENQ